MGKASAAFSAAKLIRWQGHPMAIISRCFLLIKEMTPFLLPIITDALSDTNPMTFAHGMPNCNSSLLIILKIFSPVDVFVFKLDTESNSVVIFSFE
jgi:uncharacterized membrane protein